VGDFKPIIQNLGQFSTGEIDEKKKKIFFLPKVF